MLCLIRPARGRPFGIPNTDADVQIEMNTIFGDLIHRFPRWPQIFIAPSGNLRHLWITKSAKISGNDYIGGKNGTATDTDTYDLCG